VHDFLLPERAAVSHGFFRRMKMDPSGVFGIFFIFVMFAIFARVMAGGIDKDRVRRYIEGQGGRLLESHWSPFGKGWVGDKSDRIYRVQYEDRDGNIREATVKTSMFSGVYFTEEMVVVPANANPGFTSQSAVQTASMAPASTEVTAELDRLRNDNARLREELARARREPQPLFSSDSEESNTQSP
jgi:hypothetical protein